MLARRRAFLAVAFLSAMAIGATAARAAPIIPVRAMYLVPTDRAANPAYATAIEGALLDLQQWYAGQLGGDTFALASPVVDIVSTSHTAAYYSTTPHPFPGTNYDFFFNVLDDATALGAKVDDPSYRWAVYIDAEPGPGQQGGAALAGLTIIGAPDLVGLIGQDPLPVGRWIGGLGHELGHTFGLPHPGDCVGVAPAQCVYGALDYSDSVVGGALMQFGYLTYPSTYLLPEEKAFLQTTPYFGPLVTRPIDVPEPSLLLLLGSAVAAFSVQRKGAVQRRRSTRVSR